MPQQKTEISLSNYQEILQKIQSHINKTKEVISRHKIEMAWNIGKIINEAFLGQDEKIYGRKLISNLSSDIEIHEADLYKMRSFFKTYPKIPQGREFNWTHYRILSGIKEDDKRQYFEDLVKAKSLNSRDLQNEINNTKPKPAKTANIKPSRGQLFHYQVTQIPNKADSYFLDLGFGVLKESNSLLPKDLQEAGRIVVSSKNKDSYQFQTSDLPKSRLHTYVALLDRVVDGDTIRVNLDLGFGIFEKEILRLAKINAPELKTPQGKRSFKELKKILAPYDYLIIKTLKTDIFGRYVADIFLPKSANDSPQESADNGVYLNQKLLDLDLAVCY